MHVNRYGITLKGFPPYHLGMLKVRLLARRVGWSAIRRYAPFQLSIVTPRSVHIIQWYQARSQHARMLYYL